MSDGPLPAPSVPPTSTVDAGPPPPDPSVLEARAQKLLQLTAGLKAATAQRDTAYGLWTSGSEGESKDGYARLLRSVAELELMLPPPAEEDNDAPAGARPAAAAASTAQLEDEPLQKVRETVVLLRRDAMWGLGRCQVKRDQLAEATDSFKAILLADDGDAAAWKERGAAFLSMGVPLLAELHLNQAEGRAKQESNPELVEEVLALREAASDPPPLVPALEGVRAAGPRACLALAVRLAVEGQVLFREQFFKSAADKFAAAVDALNATHESARRAPGGDETAGDGVDERAAGDAGAEVADVAAAAVPPGEAPVLRELRYACHLNIAACALLRQMDYHAAIEHCTRAAVDCQKSAAVLPLLRRAEAARHVGLFANGVADLERALDLSTPNSNAKHAPGHHDEVRKRLEQVKYYSTLFAARDTGA